VRRRSDLHHASVPAPKDVCAFAHGVEVGQYAAAIPEELLALSR
jgi:hypothetical protein